VTWALDSGSHGSDPVPGTDGCVVTRSATLAAMSGHPVVELYLGDLVRLRRRHPCGGDTWLVDRLGADIGLRCETCGRHVLLERASLERRIVGFVRRGDPVLSAAVGPVRP
jgi:hypothetical protein